jgi:hypothetical protein
MSSSSPFLDLALVAGQTRFFFQLTQSRNRDAFLSLDRAAWNLPIPRFRNTRRGNLGRQSARLYWVALSQNSTVRTFGVRTPWFLSDPTRGPKVAFCSSHLFLSLASVLANKIPDFLRSSSRVGLRTTGHNVVKYLQKYWAIPLAFGPVYLNDERERQRPGIACADTKEALIQLIHSSTCASDQRRSSLLSRGHSVDRSRVSIVKLGQCGYSSF